MGTGAERPRLEVRQQAGVLLGLLGDAVDGGTLACLDLAERDAFGRRAAIAASMGLPCGHVSG